MSLTRKYIIYTFALVIAMGAIIYPLEMLSSYRQKLKQVNYELQQIQDSHLPSLISSLWLTNYDLLQEQIEAISRFSYIDTVQVIDDEGTIFRAGSSEVSGLVENREALVYTYQEEKIKIGELSLYIDQDQISRDVFREEYIFILFHFFLAILIAFLLSFLFHSMVGRHLRNLSEFMRTDGLSNLKIPVTLRRKVKYPDELEELRSSIESMRRRIRDHFQEKDLLMREVHHRIKNNMFTVESLLALQANATEDRRISDALNEAKSRLRSMGVLYDRLYRSGNITDIAADQYFPPLVDEIIRLLPNETSIDTDVDIQNIVLNADTLASLGILLNELLTNSMKHAFPDRQMGKISIIFRTAGDRLLELRYRDNGIGIPESVISGKSDGLGMTLIRALSEQLKASLEIRQDLGTSFILKFPIASDHPVR